MATWGMRDIDELKRLRPQDLSNEELVAIRKEIERLVRDGQHYEATMLYGSYFPWSDR